MTEPRVTRLLPLACLVAAVVLFASELMTMFEFTPPGGDPQCDVSAGERHGNAMFVIASFAIGALALAVFTASRPAAVAVAAMGVSALLFFLLSDLPVAGRVDAIGESCTASGSFFPVAEAVPQGGFWLFLISSLALAVSGVALATLTPDQLAALGPSREEPATAGRSRPAPNRGAAGGSTPSSRPAKHGASRGERARQRLRSRPRD